MEKYKFGEIWLADLSPRMGTEAGKKRPVLIIQSQILLDVNHASTIVLPLTTQIIEDAEILRIRVLQENNLRKDSDIMVDQIRAIDNSRLVKRLTRVNEEILKKVKESLTDILGFNDT